jgi:hypothetical protein
MTVASPRSPDAGNPLELESLGILRQTRLPAQLAWMDDEVKFFMLELLGAGDDGVHKRRVERFRKKQEEALLRLEIAELVVWERDKTGRPMFLALTWRGHEAATLIRAVAVNESRRTASAR